MKFEDLLDILPYAILILISIIGGVVKNLEKKKSEQQKRYEADSRDYTFEDEKPQPEKRPLSPLEEFLRRQIEQVDSAPENGTQYIDTDDEDIIPDETDRKQEIYEKSDTNGAVEGTAVFESTSDSMLSDNMNEPDFSISDEVRDMEVFNYDKEEEIPEDESILEDFDPLKAVLYSEIISRPKF